MRAPRVYWPLVIGLGAALATSGACRSKDTSRNTSGNTSGLGEAEQGEKGAALDGDRPTSSDRSRRFDGITIRALTFTGPQVAEALQRRGPEFTSQRGARVEITLVPFNELYQAILDDFADKTGKYDLVVFAPQWLVDFAKPGYLEDLGARIQGDPDIAWSDIAPFFREFSASYLDRIYTVPLDGDFQMVYYRSDVLEQAGLEPPKTWDDYIAIAKSLRGKDLNGDGEPDFGSCISKKPQAQGYWMVWSVASAFLQSHGTEQGAFFDIDTMKPLVNNEAFARAIELFKKSGEYAPKNELEMDVAEIRDHFINGRCALTLDWGDTGTLAIAPGSRVVDKVGAVILPGSRQVLDRKTGRLVPCDKVTCPYAVEGVNHAPYAAFGGWSGAINASANPAVKDAAFAFLAYMTSPAQANKDVTIGASGFNPYRKSQFQDRKAWLEAGMSDQAASRYLGAIGVSLSNPNMVLDLRIPQNQRYQQVALDGTMARYLSKNMSAQEAVAEIEKQWEAITDELGRDGQREAYQASLGLDRAAN